MDNAVKIYSWKGIFKNAITATSILSRNHARNLGLFVAPDCKNLVTWVKPTWDRGRKTRVAHFRRIPGSKISESWISKIQNEIASDQAAKTASTIHNKCRDELAEALRKRINTKLPWFVTGRDLSDFPFQGDFLRGVESIETEHVINTPFAREYRLDIALLGPKVGNKRIILGAVELELYHEFEFLKCMLCKCLGFPMVSLDLTEYSESDITENKLIETLTETTGTSADGRRRNYFYLHSSLLPLFINVPSIVLRERIHQFVIFTKPERFDRTLKYLKKLREKLELSPNEYSIAQVKAVGASGQAMIENEGEIAGHDWRDYSSECYIRISLPRPSQDDLPNYFCHLILAQIVNAHKPSLVGYKFERGLLATDSIGPIWIKKKFIDGMWSEHRICPKHLSDPIESILTAIERIGI